MAMRVSQMIHEGEDEHHGCEAIHGQYMADIKAPTKLLLIINNRPQHIAYDVATVSTHVPNCLHLSYGCIGSYFGPAIVYEERKDSHGMGMGEGGRAKPDNSTSHDEKLCLGVH